MTSPHLTGLTGCIGSGKSSVAEFFCRRFTVTCLNADASVHELLEPGRACWQIIHDLGKKFVHPDQSINKAFLRASLFDDPTLRMTINESMHPVIRRFLMEKVQVEFDRGRTNFLIEVPLLFEAGWHEMFSEIIVVAADERKCRERVVDRDGVSIGQAEQSTSSQMPLQEKIMRADYVIDNNGAWEDTVVDLLRVGEKLWQKNKIYVAKT